MRPFQCHFHKLCYGSLQACHCWRLSIGTRNEPIFSGLGCVAPKPTVHSLIVEVGIHPVPTFDRQIIRSLSLKLEKKSLKQKLKLRKVEKNAEQQEQDFKDVEERAA